MKKTTHYINLSKETAARIEEDREKGRINPYACKDSDVIRRDPAHDIANLHRPSFVRDIEKIMNVPYYNRYSDKTQVFSLVRNDDISRRALHVQFVSRIARNIGRLLGLNTDLIEAIALGHDIGHTPFGHAGERALSVREAMLSPSLQVPVSQALGRVLASPCVSCPPAVPILMCGERVTQEAIEAFHYYHIDTVRVVRED